MNNKADEKVIHTFLELLNTQKFVQEDLDYSVLDKHRPFLQTLATIGKSGISVFDIFKKEHVFYSPNFGQLLGFDLKLIEEKGQVFMDEKIHPDDFIQLMEMGVSILKLYLKFSIDEKTNYKLINEYRILNSNNDYIRVIEQHQILELDKYGNVWLSMSVIDISPNQKIEDGFKSQLFDFRTGRLIPFKDEKKRDKNISKTLSKREIQILKMVKDGLLSKEISDNLDISLHTVNTHRQRVLEKLGANNSMEAVVFASKLGLL
ncbi:MAG: LuxR C-terminal-related transcriptional regulator [Mariniphaga sp.]